MRLYMTNQHSEELQSHLGSISKTFCKIKKKFPNAARPYLYQDKNFSCFVISSESVIIYLNTLLLAVLLITFLNSTIHTEYQITFRADTESYPVLSVNTYRYVTLHFSHEIGAAQLRSVTEIAPNSLFLFVNRSPIPYGFLAGAKSIRYSMNIAFQS